MTTVRKAPPAPTNWLTVPSPIASLFKRVPLAVYPSNELPHSSPSADKDRKLPILYIFTSPEEAVHGNPSFNPTCLKWQTILKIARVAHTTTPSTNHASPTGALPFLLPSPANAQSASDLLPIPSGSPLLDHAVSNAQPPNILGADLTSRQEAALDLLTSSFRPALLYALYLNPLNEPLLRKLYIDPTTSSWLVRRTLLHQVRAAATQEILTSKRWGYIDVEQLFAELKTALVALDHTHSYGFSDELAPADELVFFSRDRNEADLFDAEVFAYTQVVLDERLGWGDDRLGDLLRRFPRLVDHRQHMLASYFPQYSVKEAIA